MCTVGKEIRRDHLSEGSGENINSGNNLPRIIIRNISPSFTEPGSDQSRKTNLKFYFLMRLRLGSVLTLTHKPSLHKYKSHYRV